VAPPKSFLSVKVAKNGGERRKENLPQKYVDPTTTLGEPERDADPAGTTDQKC